MGEKRGKHGLDGKQCGECVGQVQEWASTPVRDICLALFHEDARGAAVPKPLQPSHPRLPLQPQTTA